MNNFINLIPETIFPIITEYAKILIPSFITYLVTRYSLTRPHKYEIKKQQFDRVYLPLYLLTQQYISVHKEEIKGNLPIYIKKVDKLIYKNYPYVYPKTLKLYKDLKIESSKENINIYFVSRFEYQVITHYNTLKKELGYPSDSIISFIKQSNQLELIMLISNFVLMGLFIFSVTTAFLSLFNGLITKVFLSLFASAIYALMLYLMHYITKH